MALDATEQELFDFAWAAMPEWYKARERAQEEIAAFAKVMGATMKLVAHWLDMAVIGTATGADSIDPDWLDWHAEDRGTRRRNGETDAVMRIRLRTPPDAVTRAALLAAAQEIVDAGGVVGTVDMVELPRDASFLGSYTADTGTGGTFVSLGDDVMEFIPTVPFAYPPWVGTISGRVKSTQVTFSGCSSAGNDGTFEISGLTAEDDGEGWPSITGIYFTNASGVAGADAGCTWTTERLDAWGAVIDGFTKTYVNRCHRVWRGSGNETRTAAAGYIIILPYGCTAAMQLAIREVCRQKGAAGFAGIVQRRTIP